jgi:hypothetical protein
MTNVKPIKHEALWGRQLSGAIFRRKALAKFHFDKIKGRHACPNRTDSQTARSSARRRLRVWSVIDEPEVRVAPDADRIR